MTIIVSQLTFIKKCNYSLVITIQLHFPYDGVLFLYFNSINFNANEYNVMYLINKSNERTVNLWVKKKTKIQWAIIVKMNN